MTVAAMAIDHESDSKSDGGGSSSADGSTAPPTSSSFPSADRDEAAAQQKYEEERKRKGKMLAVDQDLPLAKNDAPPIVEKLMGDAIRAQVARSHMDTLPFTAVKDIAFGDIAITNELRDILRDLGPVSPVCVHQKKMSVADRDKGQNRLLISCKDQKLIPFAKIFSPVEIPIVHEPDQKQQEDNGSEKQQEDNGSEKHQRKRKREEEENAAGKKKPGLDVQAYDRNGELYHLKCRYLTSNSAFRIIEKDWTQFLKKNNLLIEKTGGKKRRKGKKPLPKAEASPEPNGDRPKQEIGNVRIELWAFRSRKLNLGCTDQTEGALGLVLLHYREEDVAERVNVGRVGTKEPRGSEDVMKPQGSDHQGVAIKMNMGVGAQEMVMVEPGCAGGGVALHRHRRRRCGRSSVGGRTRDPWSRIEREAAKSLLLLVRATAVEAPASLQPDAVVRPWHMGPIIPSCDS